MPSDRSKRSGNPAKKKTVSTAQGWRKNTAEMELELPSGEVCLVKRPGLPQLIAADVLPDILTNIAQQAIEEGKTGKNPEKALVDVQSLMSQKEGLSTMLESFSQVTAYCVVQPICRYHRRKLETVRMDGVDVRWEDIPKEDRNPDFLYTDEVDLEDQMFIFQYVVGGSADLVEFRQQLGESMGSVAAVTATQETSV
jgi:hypothetical protein